MDTTFLQALSVMEHAFRRIEAMVPPPKRRVLGDGFVFRYEEQTIEQAIVQKLARTISTLGASRILLEKGFVQEQAALHRILDELGEDIAFLAAAITIGTLTDLHKRYLTSFLRGRVQ